MVCIYNILSGIQNATSKRKLFWLDLQFVSTKPNSALFVSLKFYLTLDKWVFKQLCKTSKYIEWFAVIFSDKLWFSSTVLKFFSLV